MIIKRICCYCFPWDAPRVLLGGSNGKWTEGAKDSIIRKSFLKGVDQSELSTLSTPKGENHWLGEEDMFGK